MAKEGKVRNIKKSADVQKYLTEVELLTLRLNSEITRGAEKDVVSAETVVTAKKYEIENLMLRVEKAKADMRMAELQIQNRKKVLGDKAKEARDFNKELAIKYNVEEGWGYDPVTGEIVSKPE